jgi:hypothetical protein
MHGAFFLEKEVNLRPLHPTKSPSLQINAHRELKNKEKGIATTGGIKEDRKLDTYPIT